MIYLVKIAETVKKISVGKDCFNTVPLQAAERLTERQNEQQNERAARLDAKLMQVILQPIHPYCLMASGRKAVARGK